LEVDLGFGNFTWLRNGDDGALVEAESEVVGFVKE